MSKIKLNVWAYCIFLHKKKIFTITHFKKIECIGKLRREFKTFEEYNAKSLIYWVRRAKKKYFFVEEIRFLTSDGKVVPTLVKNLNVCRSRKTNSSKVLIRNLY